MKHFVLVSGLILILMEGSLTSFAQKQQARASASAHIVIPDVAAVNFGGSLLNYNATAQETLTGSSKNSLLLQLNTKTNVVSKLYVTTGTPADGGKTSFTLTYGTHKITATLASVTHSLGGSKYTPLTFDSGSKTSPNSIPVGTDYYSGSYDVSYRGAIPGNYTATLTASIIAP